MPKEIEFKTKPQIALEQIKWACEAGLPRGVVIIDAGYGVEAKFRSEISELKLKYVAGMTPHTRVAARSSKCLPFPEITGRGALPIRTQRHIPDSIATLRLEIAAYLATKLERCPCCAQPRSNQKNR